MENRKQKAVITGGTAAVIILAVAVMSTNRDATKVAVRENVDSSSIVSSTVSSTASSTLVANLSSKATSSHETRTTSSIASSSKVEKKDSSKPETASSTAESDSSEPEITYQEPSAVTNNAANTWVDYYVETSPKETTTAPVVKEKDSEEATPNATESKEKEEGDPDWDGPVLNSYDGIVTGPSGNETYYNLNMSGVISNMENLGYDYDYWVRDDGVKMYGDYVMCAADLSIRPKGTIVETSLGDGIVCDTGGFANWDSTRLDIATTW